MKMITSKHQSSRLQMILLQIILAAMIIGTMLAFAVVVVITQQEANAATASTPFTFDQPQATNVVVLQVVVIPVQLHLG
jgi:cytoskeletal protein RodZ